MQMFFPASCTRLCSDKSNFCLTGNPKLPQYIADWKVGSFILGKQKSSVRWNPLSLLKMLSIGFILYAVAYLSGKLQTANSLTRRVDSTKAKILEKSEELPSFSLLLRDFCGKKMRSLQEGFDTIWA